MSCLISYIALFLVFIVYFAMNKIDIVQFKSNILIFFRLLIEKDGKNVLYIIMYLILDRRHFQFSISYKNYWNSLYENHLIFKQKYF